MINGKKIYAIIPARGGSKGIPYKAIVDLNGKPLIGYTIETALQSKYIDRTLVSTDDEKIADVARQFGAEIPFLRPAKYATDEAPSADFILHALKYLNSAADLPEVTVILQPTSPLRCVEDIDGAIEKFLESQAMALTTVCKPDISPYWFKIKDNKDRLIDFVSQPEAHIRRQDTDNLYMLNGAVYVYDSEHYLQYSETIDQQRTAYVMPLKRSIDIDNMLDLKLAAILLREVQID
jgi:CMP-N-acetylneuraminic acid synthetase